MPPDPTYVEPQHIEGLGLEPGDIMKVKGEGHLRFVVKRVEEGRTEPIVFCWELERNAGKTVLRVARAFHLSKCRKVKR